MSMSEVTESSLMSPPADTTPDNGELDSEVLDPDDLDSKDWDTLEHYLGHLLGIMLIAFSIYLRLDKSFSDNDISFIEWILFILSLIHLMYLFSRSKKYQLFVHEIDVKPKSENVYLERLNSEQPEWSTKFPANLFYPFYQHFFKSGITKETKCTWVLKKWDPSIFSLILSCYFSPSQVMILQLCNRDNWVSTLPIVAMILLQNAAMIKVFTSYINDNRLVTGEYINEYNTKYVYRKLFTLKKEVATQVNETNT